MLFCCLKYCIYENYRTVLQKNPERFTAKPEPIKAKVFLTPCTLSHICRLLFRPASGAPGESFPPGRRAKGECSNRWQYATAPHLPFSRKNRLHHAHRTWCCTNS